MPVFSQRAASLLSSLVVTFAVIRLWLHRAPDADFDLAGYNIHHLFTGLLLITVCVIPLIVVPLRRAPSLALTIGTGIGLGLALDEWVYLIATDGSNTSYLLPVSLWGGVIAVGVTALYVAALWWYGRRKRNG